MATPTTWSRRTETDLTPATHDRGNTFWPSGAHLRSMNRRGFLAAGVTAAVAGCLDNGSGGATGDGTPTGAGTTSGTAGTDAPTTTTDGDGGDGPSLADHPAARDLASQPTLGPDPAEATGVIVAFEDPSCTRCRAFERDVVPTIRSELTEPGKAAFVFRGYPVVYDWGEPAVRALEAVYARDPATHWDLVDHYFHQQDGFRRAGRDAVYDRTETFLAERTDLDAAAVVEAARSGEFDDAVGTDLDAGMAAGAGVTTPHVFLFRDGQYRTKGAGSISFGQIESVLQL